MQVINMTPECAAELRDTLEKILNADTGAPMREIVLSAGDPSGRDKEPTNQVCICPVYDGADITG